MRMRFGPPGPQERSFFDRDYPTGVLLKRAWKFVRPYRLAVFLGFLCGVLNACILVPIFRYVQPAVEALGGRGTEMSVKTLIVALSIIITLGLLRFVVVFFNHGCLSWAGAKATADLRVALFEHASRQSMRFFDRIDVGRFMGRIADDPQHLQMTVQMIFAEFSQAPFEIAVAAGFMVHFAVTRHLVVTLLLCLIGLPLFFIPLLALGRRIRSSSRHSMECSAALMEKVHEFLTCIRLVKTGGNGAAEREAYRALTAKQLVARLKAIGWGLLVAPAVETIAILYICLFVTWCWYDGIALSQVVPLLAPLVVIYRPIKSLARLQTHLERANAALARIFSALDVDMPLPEKENPIRKNSFEDSIVFENVTCRYGGASKDAVKDVSLEIKKGTIVAVVGETGCGKSTLASLLPRLRDPESGCVRIDGVDVRELSILDLRNLIGGVDQMTALFNDTIAANIAYGCGNPTMEQIVAAAKAAEADAFITAHPDGYNRKVGEKGALLSGGERQRIAIARAILRNPPILILDEATSALDPVTEREVRKALITLMKNRTVLVITHRLASITNADQILVMQSGSIVARGTHSELLASSAVYGMLVGAVQ